MGSTKFIYKKYNRNYLCLIQHIAFNEEPFIQLGKDSVLRQYNQKHLTKSARSLHLKI